MSTDYTALTPEYKLQLAQDRLVGLEADHFRTALVGETASASEKDLNVQREQQIESIKAQIVELQKAVEAQGSGPVPEREPAAVAVANDAGGQHA